jgi:hypothetical protein
MLFFAIIVAIINIAYTKTASFKSKALFSDVELLAGGAMSGVITPYHLVRFCTGGVLRFHFPDPVHPSPPPSLWWP